MPALPYVAAYVTVGGCPRAIASWWPPSSPSALELADLADAISLHHFRRASLVVESKADHSPVSEADARSNRSSASGSRPPAQPTPSSARNSASRRPPPRHLAPVQALALGSWSDRTARASFVRGLPGFATLIALEAAGELIGGRRFGAGLSVRWWAGRGRAPLRRQPIRVSTVASLDEAHCPTARSKPGPGWPPGASWQPSPISAGAPLATRRLLDPTSWWPKVRRGGAGDRRRHLGLRGACGWIVRRAGAASPIWLRPDRRPAAAPLSSNGLVHADVLSRLG